jgi:hypothetical protein
LVVGPQEHFRYQIFAHSLSYARNLGSFDYIGSSHSSFYASFLLTFIGF